MGNIVIHNTGNRTNQRNQYICHGFTEFLFFGLFFFTALSLFGTIVQHHKGLPGQKLHRLFRRLNPVFQRKVIGQLQYFLHTVGNASDKGNHRLIHNQHHGCTLFDLYDHLGFLCTLILYDLINTVSGIVKGCKLQLQCPGKLLITIEKCLRRCQNQKLILLPGLRISGHTKHAVCKLILA